MTIKEIEAALGAKVTRANATVNSKQAYRVEGYHGLFTKQYLIQWSIEG